MKLRLLLISFVTVVAIVVSMSVIASPVDRALFQSAPGNSPQPLYEWSNASFEGCCFGAGLNRSSVEPFRTVPDGTAVFSVIGSFGVNSWMKLDDGLLTESGVCANSFSPPGACNVYVGIWSPAAWKAYTNGGPLDPLWCFSSNDSGCQNVSGAYVSSPNLEAFDGVSCELVVWNVASFQLSGEYQFGVYTNLPN